MRAEALDTSMSKVQPSLAPCSTLATTALKVLAASAASGGVSSKERCCAVANAGKALSFRRKKASAPC